MNRQILLLIMLIAFSNSYSFDLFDPDRGKPPPPPEPPKIIEPPSPKSLPTPFSNSRAVPSRRKLANKRPPPPQRDFFLKGTSIIGDKRAAILKGPDGKEFVQFLDNAYTPIKNYSDYHLLKIEPGKVHIEYPAESPCRNNNEEKGIKCTADDNGKTALLTLMSQKALPPRKLPPPAVTQQPADTEKEAERNKRKELYRGFKKQVIKDEDVPPGMRVIRTPFGDRLVPIK
jgi:hypothetical protein